MFQDSSRLTNRVVIPSEGKIEVGSTGNTKVSAFVNDQPFTPLDRLWVRAGDTVHFDIKGDRDQPTTVTIQYGGNVDTLEVPARGPKTNNKDDIIMTPAETVNLFASMPNRGDGMGGALGGGLGAGLLGGLLGTMLFRRGGLDGGDVPANVATQSSVEAIVSNSSIQQTLGDIKASIPLAEGQAQLALAGAQADINSNISSHANTTDQAISALALNSANGFANTNLAVSNAAASTTAAVTTAASNILAAVKDSSILAERNAWAVTQAINNDGEKTRALIQSIDKSNDSRTITALANEISDLKNSSRLNDATHSLTINNNNNAIATAQQQQAQQQQQLQYQILNQLAALNADVQSVKQSSVVFNSGLMAGSGNQTGSNTRVA